MWNFLRNNGQTSHESPTPPTTTNNTSAQGENNNRPVVGRRDFAKKRLSTELKDIRNQPVPCVRLIAAEPANGLGAASNQSSSSLVNRSSQVEWIVEICGADGTLYTGEKFLLRFRFPDRYPLDSPEVVFIGNPPIHPHIYSNGHICLSILYDGWSPALGVMSICLSLISMLSSCEQKVAPIDDSQYVAVCGPHVSPKSMRWVFHDDV